MPLAHDVIESRLAELQRKALDEEREKTSARVATMVPPQVQARLDALCEKLDMSRSALAGQLLEAAIKEAEHYYHHTTDSQGDLLEGSD